MRTFNGHFLGSCWWHWPPSMPAYLMQHMGSGRSSNIKNTTINPHRHVFTFLAVCAVCFVACNLHYSEYPITAPGIDETMQIFRQFRYLANQSLSSPLNFDKNARAVHGPRILVFNLIGFLAKIRIKHPLWLKSTGFFSIVILKLLFK